VVPAAVYLAVLARHFRPLVQDVNWNSDVVAPMVLAGALPSVPDSPVIHLGAEGSYTTVWFDSLTRGLPAHRQIWEAAPYLVALLGLALLVWSTWRVAGRWAATATLVIAFAVTPAVLYSQMAQAYRITTWFTIALLAAHLVLLATTSMRTRTMLVIGAGVAVITGLNVASDVALFVGGVVPFVAAAVLLACRRQGPQSRRLLTVALVTAGAAVGIAALATLLMYHAGFRTVPPMLYFAGQDQIGSNISLLTSIVLGLGNGIFFGQAVSAHGIAIALAGLVTAAGVALVLAELPRVLRGRPEGPADGGARLLLGAYWSISASLLIVAFVSSTLPVDFLSIRYVIPILYSMAAVVPLYAGRSLVRRVVIAGGIAVVATMSVRSLQAVARDHAFQEPLTRQLPAVASFLESQGLTRGYAGYWNSHPLTLHSDGRVAARPVGQGANCQGVDPAALCPFHLNSVSSWYTPGGDGGPTFVLQDPAGEYVKLPPSATFGTPSSVHQIGRMTIFVYPYDVASRFEPERRPHAPGTPVAPRGAG